MDSSELNTPRMQDLLARLRKGDAAASDRLVREVVDRMEVRARQVLSRNPVLARWTQAEDLLQTALIKLYETLLDERVSPDSMATFHKIAAERVRLATIDLARNIRGPHGIASNIESHADLLASSGVEVGDAERIFAELDDQLEEWAALHEAVPDLPEQQQAVFRLHFYNGLPFPRIAEVLAIEPDSVSRTYRRACESLTALLADPDRLSGQSSDTA